MNVNGGGHVMLKLVLNTNNGVIETMENANGKIFGEAVKRERLKLKMTQKELSALTGVSEQKISGLERYGKPVTFEEGMRLTCKLVIPIEDTANGTGIEIEEMINLMKTAIASVEKSA
jgi:transcriptional regulator with XRE-family HTH domain